MTTPAAGDQPVRIVNTATGEKGWTNTAFLEAHRERGWVPEDEVPVEAPPVREDEQVQVVSAEMNNEIFAAVEELRRKRG